jgi:hypothetical protein
MRWLVAPVAPSTRRLRRRVRGLGRLLDSSAPSGRSAPRRRTLECSRRAGVGRESQRRSSRLALGVWLQDYVSGLRWWPAADSYDIPPPYVPTVTVGSGSATARVACRKPERLGAFPAGRGTHRSHSCQKPSTAWAGPRLPSGSPTVFVPNALTLVGGDDDITPALPCE